MVKTVRISFSTNGHGEIRNITPEVRDAVRESGLVSGLATVFTPSATSGLTTLEYESGCVQDLQRLFDDILPPDRSYAHNARWGDGNGHSHARAALIKPSLTIPFVDQELTLGTWQQIVFLDFDNRSRDRELVVQLMGES
jgi:secondary thiamine-phosphate synthase enzyme